MSLLRAVLRWRFEIGDQWDIDTELHNYVLFVHVVVAVRTSVCDVDRGTFARGARRLEEYGAAKIAAPHLARVGLHTRYVSYVRVAQLMRLMQFVLTCFRCPASRTASERRSHALCA